MQTEEAAMERMGKAVAIVARRLLKNGTYDIEACWAIGVLATVADLDIDELRQAAEGYSTVTFVSWGDKKIQAIKIVRTHLNVGLKDGKEIVEGTQRVNTSPQKARLIKEECERECGSDVMVRPWQEKETPIGRGLDLTEEPDPYGVPF